MNGSRAAHALRALRLSEKLSQRAHRHAVKMARRNTLFHSCVSCKYRRGAENVGVSRSVNRVHELMMASATHRANILNGSFGRVGIGVVQRGRQVWVTEIFVG